MACAEIRQVFNCQILKEYMTMICSLEIVFTISKA